MSEAQSVAVDPVTHHIFVAEWQGGIAGNNNRISEFTAWGEFVKAFGFGVRNGADELQVCTEATGCQKGLEGSDAGQFDRPNGLAFDAAGNLYVFERINARVQKFDPSVGPEGEEVQFLDQWGSPGTGDGQFFIESVSGVGGNYIAVDPSDTTTPGGTVYVADKGRIQAFDTEGNFQFSFELPEDLNPGALAFDPSSGDLYFAFNQESFSNVARPTIYRLEPPDGDVVDEVTPDIDGATVKDAPIALSVDPVGNLYVVNDPLGINAEFLPRVQKYSPSGELLTEFDEIKPSEVGPVQVEEPGVAAASVGPNPDEVAIYVTHRRNFPPLSSLRIFGAVPDPAVVGPPPAVPPSIQDQYATFVGPTEATVRAAINPNFWNDTTYYVEYGTVECSVGPCEGYPTPPGTRLTTKTVKTAITSKGLTLTGLDPGTKYFYRFVAQSTGGGPVSGPDRSFTTRGAAPAPGSCPANEAFRPEPARRLPDCRAYEMVSPIDKNGADISVLFNVTGYPAGFDQADPSGEEIAYSAYRAFAEAPGAPYAVQYLAARGASGWSTRSITPEKEGLSVIEGKNLDTEFRAFTPGLEEGWLFRDVAPKLDSAAPDVYPNLYRRDNSSNGYEALITTTPPASPPAATPPEKFRPEVQGYGGGCTVFRANDKLTEDALATDKYQLYKSCPGQPLDLVSLLPGEIPAASASAGTGAGTAVEGGDDRNSRVEGAVSADGSIVYWTNTESGPGKLHARIGDTETVAISSAAAQFWAAAANGSKAIYTQGEDLYEFTLGVNGPEAGTKIAGEVFGVMGASSDASVVYFLSAEVLDTGADAGEPNLYRYTVGEPSTFAYVATLSDTDAQAVGLPLPGPVKTSPIYHASQVTPDGGAVAFTSVAPITGFDNTDAETGKADMEVFVARAGAEVVCVSCDPGGARPTGREVDSLGGSATSGFKFPAAAELSAAANSLHAPRVISADGNRVYFDSYVPLVPTDTNGKADVYQWEATGEGGCRVGAPGYEASFAGCVDLISSGKSPQDSEFVDSSSDGRDVFFKTNSSLLPQDPGLVDIYDAREGGGFPLPASPPPVCEGEGCQTPAPAPPAPTPASQNFHGQGNPKHCPKGTRKVNKAGKQVCVKNKKKKKKGKGKKAGKRGQSGRAGR